MTPSSQSLLHLGAALKAELQRNAEPNEKWQDHARQVLQNYCNMRALQRLQPEIDRAIQMVAAQTTEGLDGNA